MGRAVHGSEKSGCHELDEKSRARLQVAREFKRPYCGEEGRMRASNVELLIDMAMFFFVPIPITQSGASPAWGSAVGAPRKRPPQQLASVEMRAFSPEAPRGP
jgi:hypothetical protein